MPLDDKNTQDDSLIALEAATPEALNAPEPGSFEYAELKILDSLGTAVKDKGTAFEMMIKDFHEQDTNLKTIYEKIERFEVWSKTPAGRATPYANNPDTGTDFVGARFEAEGGGFDAIQVKALDKNEGIDLEHLRGFVADTNRYKSVWNKRYFFTTAIDKVSAPAKALLSGEDNENVKLVTREFLINSHSMQGKWPHSFEELKNKELKKLHLAKPIKVLENKPHQSLAVADVLTSLDSTKSKNKESNIDKSARAQLHMACGTGKTVISQLLANEIIPARVDSTLEGSNAVIVALPSLNLVRQTLDSYLDLAQNDFRHLVVCSDEDIGRNVFSDFPETLTKEDQKSVNDVILIDKDIDPSAETKSNLSGTTDENEIKKFIASKGINSDVPRIIFTTYHSSHLIEKAQKAYNEELKAEGKDVHKFSLVVCDEAHNLAGRTLSKSSDDSDYTTLLHEDRVLANNRLFMTATPKFVNDMKLDDDESIVEAVKSKKIASMKDESLFGPVAHNLSFREAVNQKLIVDYEVLVLGVTEAELDEFYNATKDKKYVGDGDDDARLTKADALSKIALAHAINSKEYDLNRVLTFHSKISNAENFVKTDGNGKKDFKPEGIKVGNDIYYPNIFPFSHVHKALYPNSKKLEGSLEECISSRTKSVNRDSILKEFQNAADQNAFKVISSVRCLGEGIDIKNLNGAMIVDPRQSLSDIAQIIGRIMRLGTDGVHKEKGYIILPVVLRDDLDIEDQMNDASFKYVWNVINTLKGVDESFNEEIKLARKAFAGKLDKRELTQEEILDAIEKSDVLKKVKFRKARELQRDLEDKTPEHLIDLKKFASKLFVKMVEQCSSRILVNVSNRVELQQYIQQFFDANKNYPNKNTEGKILGTDDTWMAVNTRISRAFPGESLSTVVAEISGGQINVLDKQGLIKRIQQFSEDNDGKYPNQYTKGKITGTDDTWMGVNWRIGKAFPGESLTTVINEMQGIVFTGIKIDVTNQDELQRHLQQFANANGGNYPNHRTESKIPGTDDTWVNVNGRINNAFPGESLTTVINKMKLTVLTSLQIDVTNKNELKRHLQQFADANDGNYPKHRTEGKIPGTDDTWVAVNGRIKKAFPGQSLFSVINEMKGVVFTGIKIDVHDKEELTRHIQTHFDELGKYPTCALKEKIYGTDDTWLAVNHRIKNAFPGKSLSMIIDEIRGVEIKINVLDRDELTRHIQAHFDEFCKYPNRRIDYKIKGTDDSWINVNARIRAAFPRESLFTVVNEMNGFVLTGIKIDVTNKEELNGHIQAYFDEFRNYPNKSIEGKIPGTDDTWGAVNARIKQAFPGQSLATMKEELLSKSTLKSRKLALMPEETIEQAPEAPAEPEATQEAKQEVSRKRMKP